MLTHLLLYVCSTARFMLTNPSFILSLSLPFIRTRFRLIVLSPLFTHARFISLLERDSLAITLLTHTEKRKTRQWHRSRPTFEPHSSVRFTHLYLLNSDKRSLDERAFARSASRSTRRARKTRARFPFALIIDAWKQFIRGYASLASRAMLYYRNTMYRFDAVLVAVVSLFLSRVSLVILHVCMYTHIPSRYILRFNMIHLY